MQAAIQGTASRFLVFRIEAQAYALRAEDVSEVIQVPSLARVPQGPVALLGVANLRGSVLPIVSLRALLGKPAVSELSTTRAIVLDVGAPVAVVVDAVATLESAAPEQIQTQPRELGAQSTEILLGAFAFGADRQVAKILDIKSILEIAFANRARARPTPRAAGVSLGSDKMVAAAGATQMLVTFEVAGQEFALPLESVQEILPAPEQINAVSRTDGVVLGITSMRGSLLPLLSLRGLLGFTEADGATQREKVIVMNVAGSQVGLVADRARAIVEADTASVDPVPPVLAARVGGESRIRSVYRGDAGRRLISILSPTQLFRDDVMQKLAAGNHTAANGGASSEATKDDQELIFLVFRLGEVELGLPIAAVVEVAQVPEQITRVPKTPKFLEGVINLRGEVLPVIDQRRRFEMARLANNEGRKLVVVATERHRAGLIVDSVSDVLRVRADAVDPPPDLTEQISKLVHGVINLAQAQRMVLLLDPTELLTRAEQGLLDKFQAATQKADA